MNAPAMALLRSFRVRIALLSTALSGIVLAGFIAWAWSEVQRNTLRGVDEEIRDMGRRHLGMRMPGQNWPMVMERETQRLRDDSENPVMFLVVNRDGALVYQSPNWPKEINAREFPLQWPAEQPGHVSGEQPPPDSPDFQPRDEGSGPRPFDGEERRGPRRPPFGPDRFRGPGGPPLMPVNVLAYSSRYANGSAWRIGVMANAQQALILGRNIDRQNAELSRLRDAFLLATPAALALIALAGWLVSQRALRPIHTLTATAERITAKDLSQRIVLKDEDTEFQRLVTVFNRMLDRLESSFEQAVRFSADAAHELKTPLTILQGELEQAIQEAPPASPQQQIYNALQEEVQRLKNIIRKLLLLSLADSGQLKLNLERVDLSELLDSACEDIPILAPDLFVEKEIAPQLEVMADPDLLVQVIQNLISNALKYNQPGGTVRVRLATERGLLKCSISNSGPGIPDVDRAKVFDRFFRADKARNRKQEGVGLGLSLAREIARAHHGDIVLENADEGVTTFTLLLPSALMSLEETAV